MKPQLGNSNSQIQGFMNNGQAVSMSISAWINEPKEHKLEMECTFKTKHARRQLTYILDPQKRFPRKI